MPRHLAGKPIKERHMSYPIKGEDKTVNKGTLKVDFEEGKVFLPDGTSDDLTSNLRLIKAEYAKSLEWWSDNEVIINIEKMGEERVSGGVYTTFKDINFKTMEVEILRDNTKIRFAASPLPESPSEVERREALQEAKSGMKQLRAYVFVMVLGLLILHVGFFTMENLVVVTGAFLMLGGGIVMVTTVYLWEKNLKSVLLYTWYLLLGIFAIAIAIIASFPEINTAAVVTFSWILLLGGGYFYIVCSETFERIYKPVEPIKEEELYRIRGIEMHSLGRLQEAITYYDKALEINPKYVYAWRDKGFALKSLGKHQEAISSFQKYIELTKKEALYPDVKEVKEIIRQLKNESGRR